MDRKKAQEHLISAILETGAEFIGRDGSVIVGGLTFACREDYIVVSTEYANNFFQYETLCYIVAQGGDVCIADKHLGVFSTYKVR